MLDIDYSDDALKNLAHDVLMGYVIGTKEEVTPAWLIISQRGQGVTLTEAAAERLVEFINSAVVTVEWTDVTPDPVEDVGVVVHGDSYCGVCERFYCNNGAALKAA